MTAELVAFVRARLDDDGRRAERGHYTDTHWELFTTSAHLGAWRAWRLHYPREQWDVKANDVISEAARDAIRERITAHEKDRTAKTLREIESKRRIVAALEAANTATVGHAVGIDAQDGLISGLTAAVQNLAAVYADHPGYRPEWAPNPA